MTNTEEQKPSPIEVFLSKRNLAVNCLVVHEDESTEELKVDSLSMRGAQREITGYYIEQGYKPVGRWESEAATDEGETIEAARTFKLGEVCSIVDCSNPVHAKGYCGTHYDQFGRPQKRAVA